MILDANELPPGTVLSADVCIVGAGAAGISLALELASHSIEVLVLESGGMKAEKATQHLYAGSVADERLHSPLDRYRQRRFGGTTTIWGGRCMPFDPIDFEYRDFVPNSGWPIDGDALLPYYRKANALCEAGEFAYTVSAAFARPLRPMIEGFESACFSTDTLERFSCPTDFGSRYGRRLNAAQNVRVILHSNVTSLDLSHSGERMESLTVRTLSGVTLKIEGRQFVLATGGLEVPRLLLASRHVQKHGVGNQNDVVGRFYMCHLAGTLGALTVDRPLGTVWNGYDVSDEGVYCRRRIALAADAQRSQRIGNFVARLHHPRITDPDHRNAILSLLFLAKAVIPYEYGKRLHGEERASLRGWLEHIRNVAAGPFDAAGFAWHMFRDRKLAERKFPSIIIKPKANLFSVDFHAEQQPTAESRVTLTSEADALGVPKLRADWRYSRNDVETVTRAIALLAREFKRSRVGTLAYDPASVEFEMTRYGAYGGHHIGTARMGRDPRVSVVDPDCRVHGVANLSIASAAVFPTSSQANPTLTVVALALRLAHRLRTTIKDSRA
ncbi:MAG: GMC family oxidoreductase [Pseudomonadota bacterium]|nr:GMC family oxidoreductase [Pseudomonadota bacterium]